MRQHSSLMLKLPTPLLPVVVLMMQLVVVLLRRLQRHSLRLLVLGDVFFVAARSTLEGVGEDSSAVAVVNTQLVRLNRCCRRCVTRLVDVDDHSQSLNCRFVPLLLHRHSGHDSHTAAAAAAAHTVARVSTSGDTHKVFLEVVALLSASFFFFLLFFSSLMAVAVAAISCLFSLFFLAAAEEPLRAR